MDRVLLEPERITVMLRAIRDSLAEAGRIADRWGYSDSRGDEKELVEYYVEKAFVETLVLLESSALFESFRLVKALNAKARKNYAEVHPYEGDIYLLWSEKLGHFLNALEDAFGKSKVRTVTKDIGKILRACEYVIADRKLFSAPPKRESDVHVRIEGILRAVFTDVRTKPNIDKPIKSFQPDTGLPSVRTLIEYKYAENKRDVKRVSDELLADTRGYASKEWDHIICVIYETRRFEPERKWRQHLRDCGLAENVDVIVLRGETAAKASKPSKAIRH